MTAGAQGFVKNQKKILVTGAAGFIGFHLCRRLLQDGFQVLGVDNFTPYYSVALKEQRQQLLSAFPLFEFQNISVADPAYTAVHERFAPDAVVHLAAQAGVRYSIEAPWAYVESNLIGFQRVLESVRQFPVSHFIFASSSSVYGNQSETPFTVDQPTDHPISLYAATKKSNEVVASSYAHLYKIPTTGLRFFTVYGSWGRPDMAYFSFAQKILQQKPIQVFNQGQLRRDFTHISDIIESLVRLLPRPPVPDQGADRLVADQRPYRLLNIGASHPIELLTFIQTLEKSLGQKAQLQFLPMQPGDVLQTFADTRALEAITGYKPQVSLEEGLAEFVTWYREFHGAQVPSEAGL